MLETNYLKKYLIYLRLLNNIMTLSKSNNKIKKKVNKKVKKNKSGSKSDGKLKNEIIWKSVVGFSKYEVSNTGLVINCLMNMY